MAVGAEGVDDGRWVELDGEPDEVSSPDLTC